MTHVDSTRGSKAMDPTSRLLLTVDDVQAMYDEFKRVGLPMLAPVPRWYGKEKITRGRDLERNSPFERYLRWLRDDEDLAHKVADAWTAVVERGQAELVHCYRQSCYAPPPPVPGQRASWDYECE